MITKRMKRILEDDLGYLSSEVMEMDPQVAKVIIERSLTRPSRGMPASWKKQRVAAPAKRTFTGRMADLAKTVYKTTAVVVVSVGGSIASILRRTSEAVVPGAKLLLPGLGFAVAFIYMDNIFDSARATAGWVDSCVGALRGEGRRGQGQGQEPIDSVALGEARKPGGLSFFSHRRRKLGQ